MSYPVFVSTINGCNQKGINEWEIYLGIRPVIEKYVF